MAENEVRSASLWKQGIRDGIPIGLGYFAVSFAFGIMAKETGMTAFQAGLMSITNLTSAGQFAALGLIGAKASYMEMLLTQLVLNLRYCLMSCAFSQKWDESTPFFHRFLVAHGVTDEIFGVSVCRPGRLQPWYNYGLICAAAPGWTGGTVMGVLCGAVLPESLTSALGIAIYGMFLAVILPPAKKDRMIAGTVLSAMAASLLFQTVPALRAISSGFQIIIITIAVASVAAVLKPVEEEPVRAEVAVQERGEA